MMFSLFLTKFPEKKKKGVKEKLLNISQLEKEKSETTDFFFFLNRDFYSEMNFRMFYNYISFCLLPSTSV